MTINLAILGSTRGTLMQAIIDAIETNDLDAEIKIVMSNKKDAYILERAMADDIPTLFISPKGFSRENYDMQVNHHLEKLNIDMILLIGYMRIVSAAFVKKWHHKILNVHPSLLPKFPGLMDIDVHQAVIDAKETESGCTVHIVTEELDGGPIVCQKKCPVYPDDTAETLKERVQALEASAMIEALTIRTG